MNDGSARGTSGGLNIFGLTYEIRRIVVAQGIDYRDQDVRARATPGEVTLFDFLQRNFTENLRLVDSTHLEYISDEQKVVFQVENILSKEEYRNKLNTPGLHVIYAGHSRYGRGACFDPDVSSSNYMHGERWDQGDNRRNGLFRIGYPFVPVEIEDIEHHQYHFPPVAVEMEQPANSERHPDGRRALTRITLPENLRNFVTNGFQSPSGKYWGYRSRGKINLLMHAGWENTRSDPFDLGDSDLRCKVFCHFGCFSRDHCWRLIRKSPYKNWTRDNPPTNKFAYFTTSSSDGRCEQYWLYYLFKYNRQNNNESWWGSLEDAKRKANRRLTSVRAGFLIY